MGESTNPRAKLLTDADCQRLSSSVAFVRWPDPLNR